MFDARPILAGIWRRLRANRTPIIEITDPARPVRPTRPQAARTRLRTNVPEPHAWDAPGVAWDMETRQ